MADLPFIRGHAMPPLLPQSLTDMPNWVWQDGRFPDHQPGGLAKFRHGSFLRKLVRWCGVAWRGWACNTSQRELLLFCTLLHD